MHSRSYVSFVTTQLTRQRTSKMRQFMGYRVLGAYVKIRNSGFQEMLATL